MSNALNQQTMRVREERDNIVPSKELKIRGRDHQYINLSILFGKHTIWMEGLIAYEWHKPNVITFKESIMIPQVRSKIDFRGEIRIQQTSWNCDGR